MAPLKPSYDELKEQNESMARALRRIYQLCENIPQYNRNESESVNMRNFLHADFSVSKIMEICEEVDAC